MNQKKKKMLVIALGSILLVGVAALIIILSMMDNDLYINEICASNDGKYDSANSVKDNSGDFCDWIELYNPTDEDISLSDYSLSKDDGEDNKLGDYTIKAGGYLVVYCSKEGFNDDSVPHANFNIGKTSKCQITLKSGSSSVSIVKIPELYAGVTYSRMSSGDMTIAVPTPAQANDEKVVGSKPVLSMESGMYKSPFNLTMSAEKGEKIYYTLDGTNPATSQTRIEYTEAVPIKDRSGDENVYSAYDPLKITFNYKKEFIDTPETDEVDKATIVRAVAAGEEGECGQEVTAAYFVGVSNEDHNNLPIMSVVTDPDNLFDDEKGIYVLGDTYTTYKNLFPDSWDNGATPANYNRKGSEWERDCYIDYFESDGSHVLSQGAGMRIQGGWSRSEYQKSFRFYSRKKYGIDDFNYAFWGDEVKDSNGETVSSFDTLLMKNGGNDTNYSKFKDILQQDLLSDMDFATVRGKACVLFVDGEYWGLYTLQEDYSDDYFAYTYGVDENDVMTYKFKFYEENSIDDEKASAQYETEERKAFVELKDFIVNNDMSDEENYKKVCELIDIDNFAQYIAAECYMSNTDWPQNNFGLWKTTKTDDSNQYADGKWRFYMYDTDSTACHLNLNMLNYNIFAYLEEQGESDLGSMILSILKSRDFDLKLATAMMDCVNTVLTSDRVDAAIEEYKAQYYEELLKYFERFPTWASRDSSTNHMLSRMSDYYKYHPGMFTFYLARELGLSDNRIITVEYDDGGSVLLDNYKVQNGFEGVYFDDCELTLTAKAKKGYKFAGWEGDITSSDKTVTVKVSGNMNIRAVYDKE